MTKYVACFIVIISLLGQSLLLSVSAEPSLGASTKISTMTQTQSTHISSLHEQNTVATDPESVINDNVSQEVVAQKHLVKKSDYSQCEKELSQCVQIDSGHCTAHSYCHSGALLPMTISISSVPFSSKIMTTAWSAKTISNVQDFRPPIA